MNAQGAVVDCLPSDRHVVGVHDAVNETYQLPAGDQLRLPLDHGTEQGEYWIVRLGRLWVVAGDDMTRQQPDGVLVTPAGEELESPYPDVALRHSGQDSARLIGLAPYLAHRSSQQLANGSSGSPMPPSPHSRCTRATPGPVLHAHLRCERRVFGPAPLSWTSRRTPSRSINSPRRIARPSPSWGTQFPN